MPGIQSLPRIGCNSQHTAWGTTAVRKEECMMDSPQETPRCLLGFSWVHLRHHTHKFLGNRTPILWCLSQDGQPRWVLLKKRQFFHLNFANHACPVLPQHGFWMWKNRRLSIPRLPQNSGLKLLCDHKTYSCHLTGPAGKAARSTGKCQPLCRRGGKQINLTARAVTAVS